MQGAGKITRQDILAAYELILQRSPDSEAVYQLHANYPDRFSLGKAFLACDEFQMRQPTALHDQQYPGYVTSELAVLRRFTPYQGSGTPGFTTNFLGVRARTDFVHSHLPYDGVVEGLPAPIGSLQGET